jgi:hypothetical protein
METVTYAGELSFDDVRNIVGSVAKRYGVEKVYLFGSRARGDNHGGSDYDFSIVPGKVDDLIRLCSFISALTDALGTDVDVVPETLKDEDFNKELLRDRRVVYEA